MRIPSKKCSGEKSSWTNLFPERAGITIAGGFFVKILRFLKRLNYQQNAIVESKFQNPEMDTMEKSNHHAVLPEQIRQSNLPVISPPGIEKNPYR